MNNEKIGLELSVEEVNLILKALGNMPFNQVYELIGIIHQQANSQLFGIDSKEVTNELQLKNE
jgi:hypothetical protein